MRHGTVPRHVAGLSVSVPVGVFVVLMEDGSLKHSPVAFSASGHRVGGLLSGAVQIEEIWIVEQRLVEVRMVL